MNTKLPAKPDNIAQANVLTESRYDFNRLEKNALYCIIRQVHKDYASDPNNIPQGYSNMTVEIPEYMLAEIADAKHVKDARQALISLRHRDITIIKQDGSWLNVGFINWAEHDIKKRTFSVEVSSKIMPYLVNLARCYTAYSLTVAISLKSKWSQRFYELCCQYQNYIEKGTGLPMFYKSISQLRTMFCLENKYPKFPDFKKFVIDKAQQELKESYDSGQCDLWFEYTQSGKAENTEFKFIIHTRNATQAQKKQAKELIDMGRLIYKTLLTIFSRDKDFCEKCWDHLNRNPEKIEPLYGKLDRIINNYKGADRAKITRFMLKEDFNMSKEDFKSKTKK